MGLNIPSSTFRTFAGCCNEDNVGVDGGVTIQYPQNFSRIQQMGLDSWWIRSCAWCCCGLLFCLSHPQLLQVSWYSAGGGGWWKNAVFALECQGWIFDFTLWTLRIDVWFMVFCRERGDEEMLFVWYLDLDFLDRCHCHQCCVIVMCTLFVSLMGPLFWVIRLADCCFLVHCLFDIGIVATEYVWIPSLLTLMPLKYVLPIGRLHDILDFS